MASRPAWTIVVEDRFGTVTDEYVFEAGELMVGRSRQCDVVLPSENVSRRHARLFVEEGHLYVEDAGSSNGIWVGGERVEGRGILKDGDTARVGDFHLRIKGGKRGADERVVYARLIGRSPGAMDQTLEVIAATTLVGRGRDCGLVLVDPSVSRVHSRLLVRPDGSVLVEDVGSANGLFVNETRVKVWQLSGGDRVRFGNVEFLVELPGSSTVETAVPPGGGFGRWLVKVLPWAGGGALLVAVVAVLVAYLPGILGSVEEPPPGPPPAAEEAPSAPAPSTPQAPVRTPTAQALDQARANLASRRLDDARRDVASVLAVEPANAEAMQLSNRLDLERIAAQSVADADRALADGRNDEAIQYLLAVPPDSGYSGDAKLRLRSLQAPLAQAREKACAGRKFTTVPCIRLRALLGKVESASR